VKSPLDQAERNPCIIICSMKYRKTETHTLDSIRAYTNTGAAIAQLLAGELRGQSSLLHAIQTGSGVCPPPTSLPNRIGLDSLLQG
jgi:hypothetical protein